MKLNLPPDYESMTAEQRVTYHRSEMRRHRELAIKWADRSLIASAVSIIFALVAIVMRILGA